MPIMQPDYGGAQADALKPEDFGLKSQAIKLDTAAFEDIPRVTHIAASGQPAGRLRISLASTFFP
jgi:hypothetical protein